MMVGLVMMVELVMMVRLHSRQCTSTEPRRVGYHLHSMQACMCAYKDSQTK